MHEFGDRLLQGLLTHVVESLAGATGAGLSLVEGPEGSRSGRPVAGVGVAARLDPAQWEAGSGPLWDVLDGGPLVLPREGGEDLPSRLPGRIEDGQPVPPGLVAVPGDWGGEAPMVLSVYFARPPDKDDLEQVDRFESVVASALAVVERCSAEEMRAEQMVQMMQYRRVIEQAKGLIMGALEVDAAAAFGTLARASQHFNVRLRNLAVALVEHVGHAPAESPEDPEQVIHPTDQDRRIAAQVWAALAPSAPAARQAPPAAAPGTAHAPDVERPTARPGGGRPDGGARPEGRARPDGGAAGRPAGGDPGPEPGGV